MTKPNSKKITKFGNMFISNNKIYINNLLYIISLTTLVIFLFVVNINNIFINDLIINSSMPIYSIGLIIVFITIVITKKTFFSVKGLRYYYIFNIKSNHKKIIHTINIILNKFILYNVKL